MKHIEVPAGRYGVPVKRYVAVTLKCPNPHCTEPAFTASFDEVQRVIACPACGVQTFVPEEFRGTP